MEKLEDSHKFQLWKSNLKQNGLKIRGVEEIYTRRRYNGEVLFSLLMLDADLPEGGKIPPICFLKGEVVIVLICLIDKRTEEKYLLLVKQRRIADGSIMYEHPAGMVDRNQSPKETALREVFEETGIKLNEEEIYPILGTAPLYPSTGTSDESMYFYYAEIKLSLEEIQNLSSNHFGAKNENESIITEALPFKKAHKLLKNTNNILLNLAYLTVVNDWDLLKKLEI